MRQTLRLSPRDPLGGFLKSIGAQALMGLGRHAEAKPWAVEAAGHVNVVYSGEATLAMALANLGEMAEARKALDRVLIIEPRFSLSFLRAAFFGRTEHVEFLFDAMRRLGVED
ncbi:MAG: hypothetical protein WD673_04010 [Alphaproteobacteria bacterium]